MISPQKRRAIWAVLSLWSLFALAMPQLLWACPMAGELASASPQSCPCSAAGDTEHDHTAHSCCDQVPLPSSDTSGEGENGIAVLTAGSNHSVYSALAPAPSTFATTPALENLEPALHVVPLPPTTFPSLFSQHNAAVHSGRAPPL